MKGFGIVVPAYNEEEVIEEFIRTVEANGPSLEVELNLSPESWELVVVNDGSKDKTGEILAGLKKEFPNLTVLTHETNKGLGAALNTGLNYASNKPGVDVVITMDADLTHPPELISKLIEAMHKDDADVAIASRYVKGGGMQDVPWWRVWISVLANIFFNIFLGIKAKDVTAGYKAYSSDKIKDLKIERPGFACQLEIMVKLAKMKAKFTEIPMLLKTRVKGMSKFRFFKMIPRYAVQIIALFFVRWFR